MGHDDRPVLLHVDHDGEVGEVVVESAVAVAVPRVVEEREVAQARSPASVYGPELDTLVPELRCAAPEPEPGAAHDCLHEPRAVGPKPGRRDGEEGARGVRDSGAQRRAHGSERNRRSLAEAADRPGEGGGRSARPGYSGAQGHEGEEGATHPILDGLSDADADVVTTLIERRTLERGEILVHEGAEDPSLILVIEGSVEVHSGGTLLGTAGPGELIGEMALFAGGTRSATVSAASKVEIGVLDWNGYDALRRREHPVASVIERRGLRTLAERLAAVRLHIAAMVIEPEPQLPNYQAGLVEWLVAGLGRLGWGPAAAGDPVPRLLKSALFAGIPRDVVRQLSEPLAARVWPRGRVLFRQGEPSGHAYLVAAGRVELFMGLPDAGMWRMGSVFAGQAIGMGALAAGMGERALTAVVRRRLVAWVVDQPTWTALEARDDRVGSGFRVVMIRALSEQLATANRQLATLDQDDAELARLARAHGDRPW